MPSRFRSASLTWANSRSLGWSGECLQGGLQLLQGPLVADFEDAEGLVDAEPVARGESDGLVVRQDGDRQ